MSTIVRQKKTLTKKAKVVKKVVFEWTDQHTALHIRLFNHYVKQTPDAKLETYINKYKKYLATFILELGQSDSSTKALYFMVARWLQINKVDDRYISIYQELGFELMKKITSHEHDQTQTNKEKINYRPLSFFINILDIKIDEIESDPYLLLTMLTLQPPIRSSFYHTATFITQEKQNDKINNFILINNKTKKIFYIVNDDKVKNGRQYSNNKNSHIEVENSVLKNLLRLSIKSKPRTHLFENPEDDSFAYSTLLRWLRNITVD
jgi:hypothetical protein